MSASSTPRRRPQYPGTLTDLHRFRKTAHGHDGSSRIVMVRKTDQRTFASIKKGQEPKFETVTRETIETFRGQRTECKITTEKKGFANRSTSDVLRALSVNKITKKPIARKKMDFPTECLKAHNDYRKLHGVPPLVLNKEISKVSQQWADYLIQNDKFEHSNNENYGENLFFFSSSNSNFSIQGKQPVDDWYNEIKAYDFSKAKFAMGTGHFTQVVWKDSKELGVGIAKQGGKIIVCTNYFPRGNIVGHFADNVPPPNTSPQTPTKKENNNNTIGIQDKMSSLNIKNRSKSSTCTIGKFEQDFLDKHNEFRALHGVPPLKLDKKLCKYSDEWAKYLADLNKLEHRPESNYGESIYYLSSNQPGLKIEGAEPVEIWYEEMKDFTFGKEPKNLKAGHFTQVIWKNSKLLGVGLARNNGAIYLVANYSPAGNFIGDFVENVPPPLKSITSKNTAEIKPVTPTRSIITNGTKSPTITNGQLLSGNVSNITEGNFKEDFLEAHNSYRRKHGVLPLELDESICKASQEWAEHLASIDDIESRPKNLYGENIYCLTTEDESYKMNGHAPVDNWYESIKYHCFSSEPTDLKSGHFTQVIWKSTKKLGVGIAKNNKGSIYVVANYSPPGNYTGEFLENINPVKPTFTKISKSPELNSSHFSEFALEALKVHNEYRRKHGVSELKLNKEMCNYAQEWADICVKNTSFTHRANNKYGENIFGIYSSDLTHIPTSRDAIKEWYDECKMFEYNVEKVNRNCLHFTQIVWKDCEEMGIGVASDSKGYTYVVANYSPRGNIVGKFVENVPRPKF